VTIVIGIFAMAEVIDMGIKEAHRPHPAEDVKGAESGKELKIPLSTGN